MPVHADYTRPGWVPAPADYFGGSLDPLTTVAPARPAAWPAAEAVGYYYIHPQGVGATDTANPYGYPNKPRVSVPTTFAAGSYVELHGTFNAPTTTWYLTFNGTAAQPIWFRGASADDRPSLQIASIVPKGSYVIMENLTLGNGLADTTIAARSHNNSTIDHLVCRNNIATGRGPAGATGGSVFSARGTPALGTRMQYIVFYNNIVSNYGDYAGTAESDFHAFTASSYASYVWILGNTASLMGGDGAQIGNATATAPDWTTDWFLDGNTFHTNGENAVDVKGCARGIVSRNLGYGFDGHKLSSPGEAFIIHNNPEGIWAINNIWHSANLGMISTGAVGNYWIGNLVRDCTEGISPDRGGGNHYVYANTIARCATGFSTTGSVTSVHLNSNIIYDHAVRTLEATNTTARNASTATNDLVFEPGGSVAIDWGSVYSTAAAWDAADADVSGSLGADPLFVDAAANDFNLQSASPARDAGNNWIPAAQGAFTVTFGSVFPSLGFSPVDLNGTLIDSTPDIGAYQFSLSAPPAVAPTITTQPVSQAVITGASITFTAAAGGTPIPTYQWRKGGVVIGGATGAAYTITGATLTDAGSYSVIATNIAGSAVSAVAMLTVRPAEFDVAGYYFRNPSVATSYGADHYAAWLHYRNTGIYNGETFDEIFRIEEYLALYPELFALYGADLGAALEHWLTTGKFEGRLGRIPTGFSAPGYFARNPDVAIAVNNDPVLAWGHFWLYGIYEGRAFDEELRVFEYLAINTDLQTAFLSDWRAATLHWLRYGRTEGRLGRIPLIFNSTEYLTRYPEVGVAWGTYPTTVWLHFWLYGLTEGRNFDDIFRVDEYLEQNPDLAAVFGTDRRGAFIHWVRYGQAEGRRGRNP